MMNLFGWETMPPHVLKNRENRARELAEAEAERQAMKKIVRTRRGAKGQEKKAAQKASTKAEAKAGAASPAPRMNKWGDREDPLRRMDEEEDETPERPKEDG